MDVPAAPSGVSGASVIGGAVSQAGANVAQASMNLYAQLRHAEAESVVEDTVQKQTTENQQWWEQQKLRSKNGYAYDESGQALLNPDGTQLSLTDHYKQWSDERFRKTQETLPSPYAQERYRARMGQEFHRLHDQVWNGEMQIRLEYIGNLRDERIKREANSQNQAPNVGKLYQHLDQERVLVRDLVGKVYSENQAQLVDKKLLKEVPDALFQGYEAAILSKKRLELEGEYGKGDTRPDRITDARNAIMILMGQDGESVSRKRRGMPTLSEMMDPDQKANWLKRFNTLLEHAGKHDANDWAARGDRIATALRAGERVDNAAIQSFYQEGVNLHGAKAVQDLPFVETLADIAAMKKAAPVLKSWEFFVSSPEKQSQMMDHLADEAMQEVNGLLQRHVPHRASELKTSGVSTRARIRGELEMLAQRANREAEEDFPAFATRVPKNAELRSAISYGSHKSLQSLAVRASIRTLDQQVENLYQSRSGIPGAKPPTYLDKSAAEEISVYLNGIANSDLKTDYLLNLHRANPRTYNHKINQLITAGKLKPSWYVALSIGDDRIFAAEMVNAITNPLPDSDAILKAENASISDVKANIYDKSKAYIDALISKNPNSPITSREIEAVNSTIFNMVVRKVATEKTSPSTAVDEVVGGLVNTRFAKIDTHSGLFTTRNYMLPKRVGEHEFSKEELNVIQRNMSAMRSAAKIAALAPDRPSGLDPRIPTQKFYETAAGSLKFRPTATHDSVVPMWFDSVHQQWVDLTKGGRSIQIPLLKLREFDPGNQSLYDKFMKKVESLF